MQRNIHEVESSGQCRIAKLGECRGHIGVLYSKQDHRIGYLISIDSQGQEILICLVPGIARQAASCTVFLLVDMFAQ